MRWLHSLRAHARALFARRRLEQDMDAELRFHLEQEIAERVTGGMSREEATREAQLKLGNVPLLRDEARDAWGWSWLEDIQRDTVLAFRMLRRSPAFTLTAILTLALGIGANSAMFSVTNLLFFRPLYERPSEVSGVYGRSTEPPGGYRALSYPNYRDLRERSDIFANLSAFTNLVVGMTDGDVTRRTLTIAVSADYFDTFGRPPVLGRAFTIEEERPGADIRVAILSYDQWERMGRDLSVLGQTVRVNSYPFTVVGVAPEGFTGTTIAGPPFWVPLGVYDTVATDSLSGARLSDRANHALTVMGRLGRGLSTEAAAAGLAVVARQLEQAFPAANANHTLELAAVSRLGFSSVPDNDSGAGAIAMLLTALALVVLLVACLNLANLLVARSHLRRQEIAIRLSLGGGRGRLRRQLLTEGFILALVGGTVGLFASLWATGVLRSSVGTALPAALVSLPNPQADWPVVAGTLGFCVLATVFFGAGPAWILTRPAALEGLGHRASEERGATGGGHRVGQTLVVCQVALSLTLLTAGGLFLMSSLSVSTADPGFSLERGLLVDVDPSLAGYDEARGRETYRAFVDRLRAIPGVEAASVASHVPLGATISRAVTPAGSANVPLRFVLARFGIVGRDHFRALGLPILRGRDFVDAEVRPGVLERVAIIDDALAGNLWPNEDALGRQIRFGSSQPGPPMRIVGIVPTVRDRLAETRPVPHIYVPLGQEYRHAMTLHVRIAGGEAEGARAMLGTVARTLRDVDGRVPLFGLRSWRDHRDASHEAFMFRIGATVFTTLAGLALLLTVIGVYGVKTYVVSRRTREFGVRIAIGAKPREVLWLVLGESSRLTAIGIGIGLLLAAGTGLVLRGLLYGVEAVEPLVLFSAPLVLVATSLLASYLPARRATKVDPTVALRCE